MKVHLDTDFGGDIDDLCALALLLKSPQVEITGVTTVVENQGRRAGYVRATLALAGRPDVPVAAGADASLDSFRSEYGLPPEERYWPEPVLPAPGPIDAALDLLQESIAQGAIIVGIGPFTNLSLLERRAPGVLRWASLCLMGGSIHPAPTGFPAWGHEADFNVQADHRAAQHVLESAQPTLVPIEVTAQTALTRAHLPALQGAGAIGRLIARQAAAFAQDEDYAAQYGRTYAGLPDDLINFQHDPLACAVALGWGGVTVESLPLAVVLEDEWLRLRIDAGGCRRRVVTGVDPRAFSTFWLETVTRG
ncbi:MAG: nucleoside hydrolase [Chloroflexota bacterium]|nr:nucleoside hydrolase [Chloroflexota bacterium]